MDIKTKVNIMQVLHLMSLKLLQIAKEMLLEIVLKLLVFGLMLNQPHLLLLGFILIKEL